MRKFLIASLLLLASSIILAPNTSAASLSLAPLEYRAKLESGEVKKGWIDIVNSEIVKATVRLEVRAFEQIDSEGNLRFYEDQAIQAGVKLDLDKVELGPGEGARVYFMIDSHKLPKGNVFAAILASSGSDRNQTVTVPGVRLGSLLMLQNGANVSQAAEVSDLKASFWQLGGGIESTFKVKNTTPEDGSGFFPQLTISGWQIGDTTSEGPLVFPGISRPVTFRKSGSFFGPIKLTVGSGETTQQSWLFAVTGFWRWLAPALLLVVVGAGLLLLRLRK